MSTVSKSIASFEENGVLFLSDLELLPPNLFMIGVFNGVPDAKYRIRSIKVKTPEMSFERVESIKLLKLSKSSLPEEVEVEWVEDAYRSVEKMHNRWMAAWYDFRSDFVRLGSQGKFKNINIVLYHYVNENSTAGIPVIVPQPVATVSLIGCVPTNSGPGQQCDWSKSSGDSFSTTYKIADIQINYTGTSQVVASDAVSNGIIKYGGTGYGGKGAVTDLEGSTDYTSLDYAAATNVAHWAEAQTAYNLSAAESAYAKSFYSASSSATDINAARDMASALMVKNYSISEETAVSTTASSAAYSTSNVGVNGQNVSANEAAEK